VKPIIELVGELVEHMRVVAEPGEQDQGLAAPAPVEHFQLHAWLYRDETDLVGGDVTKTGPAGFPSLRGRPQGGRMADDGSQKADHEEMKKLHIDRPRLFFTG